MLCGVKSLKVATHRRIKDGGGLSRRRNEVGAKLGSIFHIPEGYRYSRNSNSFQLSESGSLLRWNSVNKVLFCLCQGE